MFLIKGDPITPGTMHTDPHYDVPAVIHYELPGEGKLPPEIPVEMDAPGEETPLKGKMKEGY
jgi:hypothetical protein